jgi:acetoin utilization protein AcuB
MLVKAWMNTDVITVNEDTPMTKASTIIKENKIRSLPVLNKKGRLVGIITDRDLREASPSIATSLNVHELNYLVSKVKVQELMRRKLVFVKPDETIEFAAILMLDNKISALPVVNDNDDLVGIITQTDIFKALVNISGGYTGGIQFAFKLENRPGAIKEVTDEIRSHGARLVSVLSTPYSAQEGFRNIYIRIQPLAEDKKKELVKALGKKFTLLYSVCDYLELVAARRAGVSHFPLPLIR